MRQVQSNNQQPRWQYRRQPFTAAPPQAPEEEGQHGIPTMHRKEFAMHHFQSYSFYFRQTAKTPINTETRHTTCSTPKTRVPPADIRATNIHSHLDPTDTVHRSRNNEIVRRSTYRSFGISNNGLHVGNQVVVVFWVIGETLLKPSPQFLLIQVTHLVPYYVIPKI